ncbi:M20 metallopeptidase family protein [Scopulibacillus cellulosilyticus]|uniref:M20 family metallopeptidase n=1 Tax=Scopulibacillus cellulosilyticus TaxID=2665665 RepID=A0ABW2Q2N6_9BACL
MSQTELLNNIEKNLEPYLQKVYKHLHQHPELSAEEYETQAFIKSELDRLDIPYKVLAKTGLCAEIHGSQPGKTILLRSDIDALPITEQTNLEYASKVKGIMHACGHDAHTTIGLGIATLLQERKSELKGTVKIMFQPSEEVHPGGAKRMIEEGILENPRVDAAIGIHSNPYLSPGQFEVKDGYMLANSDRIFMSLIGKGGHAAAPQQSVDAIAMAGQFISGIQNIVSRQVSPLDHAVITIGKINGGYTSNVIADKVDLAGTVRSITKEAQDTIEEKIEALLKSVADYWGGSYTYEYKRGYPAVWNDPSMTELVKETAESCFGKESIVELEKPYMSGDDFTYLAQAVPSVFVYWGSGIDGKEKFPWHHPKFEVNLSSLKYAVALGTECIQNFLNNGGITE